MFHVFKQPPGDAFPPGRFGYDDAIDVDESVVAIAEPSEKLAGVTAVVGDGNQEPDQVATGFGGGRSGACSPP